MPSATYVLSNHDAVLDNPNKRYILRVRDQLPDTRPLERLMKEGARALPVAELLAVVLTTGTAEEGVLEVSSRILKDYGQKGLLSRTDPVALAEDLGIPLAKAAQIVAMNELGRRYHHHSSTGLPVIRTAEDVFAYALDMRALPKEHLRGLYLNAHYQVIHDEVISIGTADANLAHPREIFKPALEYSAAGVVLVHNHPSGITDPSETDLLITKQIAAAGQLLGIDLIDHVIVAATGFASIPIS